MEILIRQLSSADLQHFKDMLLLFERVFEMQDFSMPNDAHLQALLSKPDFIAFVAIHRGAVVGGITAYTLHSYYQPSAQVYVYDLAVDTAHQRRGFGAMLLQAVRSYCRENNCSEVFVQADASDTHALDFYRATGGAAEDVVHFTYRIS